jgi:response regulator RpfG family c-di-GMP phosphodiesterase
MCSNRPYQKAKPKELVLDILQKEQGTAFNPFLVQHFLKLVSL